MKIYRKTFRCSVNFPVAYGDEWNVRENGKVVERWHVLRTDKASFEVEIKELVEA
jgi:hypothetical protein